MKQLTLDEFRQNLRESKSALLKKLRKQMIIVGAKMEKKVKNEPSFRLWKNRTGRLAGSISNNYSVIDGKPSIKLQAGGQFKGKDVFYAGILEFGSPAKNIKVGKHTVRRNGKTFSRGPYEYTRPNLRGRFYMKRTVEWGAQQFDKELRNILTTAIIEGRNG